MDISSLDETSTPSGSVTGTSSGSQTGSASPSSSETIISIPSVQPVISTEGIVFSSLIGTIVVSVIAYMICARRRFKTRKTTTASR